MTLFRQIALLVSLLFLLLAGTIMWSNISEYNHYTQGQLQTTASDMATNLGVTIANSIEGRDVAAIDTLFNSVFDSGYYSRIELISPEGEIISERQRPLTIRQVPGWFVSAMPLEPATGSTMVMQGWQPLGTLKITLHPGYAYAGMFDAFKDMLLWLLLTLFGGLAGLWLLLRTLLKPLKTVRYQAEAIEENRFHVQKDLPKTAELYHVSVAMNRMVEKVEHIFNEQARTLNLYHELLYQDTPSGLGNRRYFITQLDQIMRMEEHSGGTLILLNLHGLEQLNEDGEFELAEQTLTFIGDTIEKGLEPYGQSIAARLNDDDFSIFMDAEPEQAHVFCKELVHAFSEYLSGQKNGAFFDQLWLCAGLAPLLEKMSVSELLARADFALAQAKNSGPCTITHAEQASDNLPLGKIEWRNWLQEALENERFFLVGQPVYNHDNELLHHELFVRLRTADNNVLPAGRFMPVAASLGLDLAIDRQVQKMALEHSGDDSRPIAINISRNVFSDAEAMADFEQFIDQFIQSGTPLYIEIHHATLLRHPKAVYRIAERVRQHGSFFGIDHFDPGSDMQSVRKVRPSYIKVNARQLLEMASDASLAGIQPLRTLAHSMDIKLIAIGIDQKEMLDRLEPVEELGFQGNLFGEPEELK